MQKGKGSTASPSAVVLSGRPPQSAPRGVPQPQPRPEEFNQGSRQSYQNIGGPPMPQALVVGPGPMPGQLQTQGQPRLPNQQPFYHGQGRPIRIQRHHNPQNQPMYSSPPGGHMLPIFPPGAAQFISQQQNPQFMQQHVDFSQIPMTAPPQVQYRTQQPMQGQFPPTSGPPQPQGHFGYPQQPMYPMAQPPSNVYFVRAPAPQMSGIQPLQTPNYQEPRTRERKIIQIKDPSSNKDVTQEILQGGHSSGPSVTGSTGGTPNTTPDVSGHSSSSSTPPLTLQQQAEANVRAQFAAQVAATLATNAEEKALSQAIKPGEVTIQKPVVKPVVVDTVKTKEVQAPPLVQKDEVVTETELSESVNVATEVQSIEQPSKEQQMETKEVVEDSKVEEVAVTVSISTESQSAVQLSEVSKADIGTSDKKADAAPAVVDVAKVLSNEPEQSSSAASGILMSEGEPTAPEENAQQATSETAPVIEDKVLNGPVSLSKEEEEEEETKEEVKEEEVVGIKNDTEVEAPPVPEVAEPATVEEVAESKEQPAVEPQAVVEESEDLEVLPTAMETEDSASAKRVNGHEPDVKSSAASKNPAEGKVDMKKKKQKHRLKDIEKRSSEKESDMMDAYTERPVKEEVPVDAEGNAAEVTEQKGGEEEVEVEEPQSEEETWEDKEETWSQLEGESDGKLTYERDFLLQFQYNPLCTLKPEGLPDLEVVLGTARAPPKPGYQSNRMPNSGGGGDMFLPGFMRSNSRTNPQTPRGGRNRPPPKKVITLQAKPTEVDLKRSDNRWVRPNDVPKTEDLYRKVRSILNKLTPQKFQTLTQQIIDLDIDTAERLEGVIDLIFEKAIDEPGFSVAYANMCRCLIPKKVVVEKDGKELAVTFRKILLNKCQKEFEKEKSVEKIIHEKLEDLSNKGLTDEERAQKKEEIREEETKAKRRTLGNIRFIGELFKLKMLTESIMHDCVVKLLRSNDEESFECLCKLLVTIGKDLDHEKAKPRVDQYFNQIGKIISARITSSRVRFMMQDIEELRSNKWVPRREDNNPKTIDQIHKEAADEAKKTQMIIQQAKQENKRQRGNMGGRDSPRPSAAAAGEETWTTVGRGPRNMSVDPKKFQNIKRPVDSENISLGPGGRGYGAWARGSSGGTGAVGAGAGSSAAAAATATAAAEPDSRPTGNRYSALAGERRSSAPSRQNSGGAGRQEPRSPVSTGGRRGPPGPAGDREKALEAVRAMSQPKRNNQEREAGRESPKLAAETPAAAAAVAASEAPASVAAATTPTGEPELTSEEMQKKAVAIIDEYLNINDMKEAVLCVKDLQSPSTHHEFVSTAFNHTMEKKVSDRNATGKLMHSLLREGVLETEQYLKGIEEIFELGEDYEIDIPLVWTYLGQLIGATAFDGILPLHEIHKLTTKYVSRKRNGAKLFAQILLTAKDQSSPEDVTAVWQRSNVPFDEFFDSQEDAIEFVKEKNIEFALGQASSAQSTSSAAQHTARIQEELRTLILKRKARNEEVFDWIDQNVQGPDTKDKPFIRTLVTAVCEQTLEKEQGGSCKCNSELLKDRKAVLQRYIDGNAKLELQALYAVQALFVSLDHPPGFMKSFFDCLYDEEVITEDSYLNWEKSEDPQEQNGKGVARTATSDFFQWLKSASEESGEDS